MWRRALAGGLAIALLLAGHLHARDAYYERLNTTDPPVPSATPAPAPPRLATPARRMVILILDGLGFEAAMSDGSIRSIAATGAIRPILAEFPSFTHPGLVSISTGRPPRWSGVRTNRDGAIRRWDTLTHRAIAAGIPVRLASDGHEEIRRLVAPSDDVSETTRDAIAVAGSSRSLDWVYDVDVDRAGHHGGTSSEGYRQATEQAGALVARFRAVLDPSRDILIALSDHGHLAGGGHGGVEPEAVRAMLLATGGPVTAHPSALEARPMCDEAATLAWLLGIDSPSDSLGLAMTDLAGRAPEPGVRPADAADRVWTAAFDAAARRRAWIAALVALAAALLLTSHPRAPFRLSPRDFLPAATYLLLYAAGCAAFGYRMSWSIPRGEASFVTETAAVGIVASLLAASRGRTERRVEEAVALAIGFGVPYAIVAAYAGLDSASMAGPRASFAILAIGTAQFYPGAIFGVRALIDRSSAP